MQSAFRKIDSRAEREALEVVSPHAHLENEELGRHEYRH
jgi:hypothetical protein